MGNPVDELISAVVEMVQALWTAVAAYVLRIGAMSAPVQFVLSGGVWTVMKFLWAVGNAGENPEAVGNATGELVAMEVEDEVVPTWLNWLLNPALMVISFVLTAAGDFAWRNR